MIIINTVQYVEKKTGLDLINSIKITFSSDLDDDNLTYNFDDSNDSSNSTSSYNSNDSDDSSNSSTFSSNTS